ncbi:MAG: hypothetical protein WEB33_02470 [Bacteroidota bacterium]
MSKSEIENRLIDLRLRRTKLEKELEDRENLEKGIREVANTRPIPLRSASQIRLELQGVLDDIDNFEKALPTTALGKGKLKRMVDNWAKGETFKVGETVPSKKIDKFVRDLKSKGIKTSVGSVRAKLSELGYSDERKGRGAS